MVENNPQISTRQVSADTEISQSSVCRILKKHKYHAFHVALHQELHGDDFENRVTFCHWAEKRIRHNENFFNTVLFTDECSFKNNGHVNKHNLHYWAVENPHLMLERRTQNYWSLNVWEGVIDDRVIGPYFFDDHLNGEIYATFLENSLALLLDDVPLDRRQGMWYQQDGAPPHYSQVTRAELHRQFGERWISRGGPIH